MVTRTSLRSALRLTVSVATRLVIETVGVIAESPVTLFESPSDGRKKARTTKNEMTANAATTFARRDRNGRFFFTSDMDTNNSPGFVADCVSGILYQRRHSSATTARSGRSRVARGCLPASTSQIATGAT